MRDVRTALNKSPVLTAIGAFLLGLIPTWCGLSAVVAIAHNNDIADPWLAAFLPQVLLGVALGSVHRWIWLPVGAGVLSMSASLLLTRDGPFAPYILAMGWPILISGLIASSTVRVLRHRAAV